MRKVSAIGILTAPMHRVIIADPIAARIKTNTISFVRFILKAPPFSRLV